MIAVLCEVHDRHALWLVAHLRARGRAVEVWLPEDLMVDAALDLHLDTTDSRSTLRSARGPLLDAACRCVINRLDRLPPLRAVSGAHGDAAYLTEEWRAALAAVLSALPVPVLNPPSGAWLAGPSASDAQWRSWARACGLAIVPWTSGPALDWPEEEPRRRTSHVFVVGDRVVDPDRLLDAARTDAVRRLASLGGLALGSLEFDVSLDEPRVLRGVAMAALAEGGTALVDAVERIGDVT